MKCVVCYTNEATQKHHIKYDPPILIDVCVSCHIFLHDNKHGVGRGKGETSKEKSLILIPHPMIEGTLTFEEERDDDPLFYIMSSSTKEELNWLVCPNKDSGCKGKSWNIYGEASTKRIYGRCKQCGYDFEFVGVFDAKK